CCSTASASSRASIERTRRSCFRRESIARTPNGCAVGALARFVFGSAAPAPPEQVRIRAPPPPCLRHEKASSKSWLHLVQRSAGALPPRPPEQVRLGVDGVQELDGVHGEPRSEAKCNRASPPPCRSKSGTGSHPHRASGPAGNTFPGYRVISVPMP